MHLEQNWFRIWEDRPGIWVIEEPLHSENVKSYLIIGRDRAALIDTGMGVGDLREAVRARTELPIIVLQSHAHNDHVGSAWQFDDVRINPIEADALANGISAKRLENWFNPNELSGPLPPDFNPVGYAIPVVTPTGLLNDGDSIDLGDLTLEVFHVPGHSAGGLVFLDRANRNLYSTDVIYLQELYLMNPDSSVPVYVETLERLIDFVPLVDRLYPSHGPTPISPSVIPAMAAAMREVRDGRSPDTVDYEPIIDGGREDTREPDWIEYHRFGDFDILFSSWATRK